MTFDSFSLERLRLTIKRKLESLCQISRELDLDVHVALLDSKGDLIDALGPNPLHFAGIEATVKATKAYLSPKRGETIITNDPYSGNSRLCDLLLIQGGFGLSQANELRYFVALQVSIPQLLNKNLKGPASTVDDEGFRIPPTPLEQNGVINNEIVQYLCLSQIKKEILVNILEKCRTSLRTSAQDIISTEARLGREAFVKGLEELKKYSEKMMRRALHEIPDGDYSAAEIIEDDGFGTKNLRIQCRLIVQGENILLSFLGTSKQTKGPFNCNYAMTLSTCFWMLRSLVKQDIPVNAGAFKAFSVEAPDGTLVNARSPSALLGGYFETTKILTSGIKAILIKALPNDIPAFNGTSSSLAIIKFKDQLFAEPLGCGAGASLHHPGPAAIHTELNNSRATSIENLEEKFPITITHSGLRLGSGGDGRYGGGDGITRGIKFLEAAEIFCLSERRSSRPKGLFGGGSAAPSEFTIASSDSKKSSIQDKNLLKVEAGQTLVINSPGGGGWGKKEEPEPPAEI